MHFSFVVLGHFSLVRFRKVKTHQLQPGQKIKLEKLSTTAPKEAGDREAVEEEFIRLRDEFVELQYDLYAEGQRKLLIVLQAMDAAGKDGTIRNVFKGVNPQGVQVASFKAPSAEELAHDFLWRIHKRVPAKGAIGIFNRSHYEDVLVVRVDNLVPEQIWRPRYEQINRFEQHLTENGTILLKFYLHISSEEQKKRFQQRLDDPKKRWKFSAEDLEKRRQWPQYMEAYEEVIERCTTDWAPWYVIPSDQKWYRNYAITRVIVKTLQRLELQLPKPPKNWQQLEIE